MSHPKDDVCHAYPQFSPLAPFWTEFGEEPAIQGEEPEEIPLVLTSTQVAEEFVRHCFVHPIVGVVALAGHFVSRFSPRTSLLGLRIRQVAQELEAVGR
jgi:hypothetical protein